ncbi:MAG TPA: hemerythrin domain-containing protein [Candidatus Baltobacteraceae bacterium]|nr:hemerythrin domain-containing protein [Candidatus Baltobacteraceae bacterium]
MTGYSITKLYREQHARLREHAAKMAAAADPAEQRTLLAQFAGQVKMHLKAEDDSLYPRLLAHADGEVRNKAAELQRTMGLLAATFQAFYEKWIKPGAITANVAAYGAELRAVVDALAKRMDMEDRELYDLAERALTAA